MGIAFQIIGVLALLASLVCSIILLINGTHSSQAVALLIAGIALIRLGRKIYRDTPK